MKRLSILLLSVVLLVNVGCNRERIKSYNVNYPAAYVVNTGDSTLSVINLNTQAVTETIDLMKMYDPNSDKDVVVSTFVAFPHHINMSGDKQMLAISDPGMDFSLGHTLGTASAVGKVIIMNPTTGGISRVVSIAAGMNHNGIFSPDGKFLWAAAMANNGNVYVFDLNQNYKLVKTIAVGKNPMEITFSADGTKAFVPNHGGNTVSVIDVATQTVLKTVSVGNAPVAAWAGGDGKMYVQNEEGKSISVIDATSMAVEETVNLGFKPNYAAFNSTNNELWVSELGSDSVAYCQKNGSNWELKGKIQTANNPHAIVFSNDGKTAFVTNNGANSVSVIDADAKTKTKDINVGIKPNGILLKY
jgi:YVTN family beta-propeller protein